MKNLKTKDVKFTVDNADDEKGLFTGYLSIFDVIDSYGDVVLPGAFKRTLKNTGQFPLLWSHNVDEPIGVFTGAEDEKGLYINGALNLDVQRAREVRSLMKQGAVNGLSIGYQTVKEAIDKETGVRQLKEVKLWEGSPCVFQACPDALIEDVKAEQIDTEDSEKSTPPEDKGNPETECLHLLDEANATAKAISNLLEAK